MSYIVHPFRAYELVVRQSGNTIHQRFTAVVDAFHEVLEQGPGGIILDGKWPAGFVDAELE